MDSIITTFERAYSAWSLEHRHLYFSVRDVVKQFMTHLPPAIACKDCTLDTIAEAMSKVDLVDRDKTPSASVIVHVLEYAHHENPKDNPYPNFTYEEIMEKQKKKEKSAPGEQCLPSEPKEQLPVREPERKPEGKPLHKPSGNPSAGASRPVVQIDTKTIEVVNTYKSVSDASRKTGAKNIKRAIEQKGIAGGFYWCFADEASDFKPGTKLRSSRKPKGVGKPQPVQEQETVTEPVYLPIATNDQIITELRARGWKGTVKYEIIVEL